MDYMVDVKTLIQRAAEFHGHLGPYLVLGLRAGLAATNVLGYAPRETRAEVKTHLSTPQSCFIDGVQFSTGCTLGKMNIKLIEDDTQSAVTLYRGGRRVRVRVKDEVIAKLKSTSREMEKLALTLAEEPDGQLFDIEVG
ncbi:MAG: formylmethanofuran dehydrogenase subunit E family protein [Candidatus Bathyarchaeia archaeon]